MAFELLREAEAYAKLGPKAKTAETIKTILGVDSIASLREMFDATEFEVTPQHYQQWLTTIMEIAAEQGVSLRRRADFNEIAFEILDNDSLVDALGGDPERTKGNIVNALWQAYKVNQAHTRVQQHVAGTIDQAREDEEAVNGLCGAEDEEGGFEQAFDAAKGVENEEKMFPRRASARPVFHAAMKRSKKNPYPAGSLRAALWADANKGMEDEEFDEYPEDASPEDGYDDSRDTAAVVDTDAMSPEDLASHITGATPDLEQRVDDLEDRIADLEHEGDDQVGAGAERSDVEFGAGVEADVPADAEVSDDEPQFDEEEAVKTLFRHAITAPKEHLSAALKDVESEGMRAWLSMQIPKNPHPKNSPAHKAWIKGFRTHAKQALGIVDKPREVPSKHRAKKK